MGCEAAGRTVEILMWYGVSRKLRKIICFDKFTSVSIHLFLFYKTQNYRVIWSKNCEFKRIKDFLKFQICIVSCSIGPESCQNLFYVSKIIIYKKRWKKCLKYILTEKRFSFSLKCVTCEKTNIFLCFFQDRSKKHNISWKETPNYV